MNSSDIAWMLVATALVLLMTPALGFFYGGLVRSKNASNTMMMSCLGPRLRRHSRGRSPATRSPSRRGSALVGGPLARPALGRGSRGAGLDPARPLHGLPGHVRDHHGRLDLRRDRRADALRALPRVSDALGAPRLRAHRALGLGRRVAREARAPSTSPAGRSCTSTPRRLRSWPPLVLKPRKDFARQAILPHNVPFTLLGAGLLWFGWFGFNAGSALGRQRHRRPSPSSTRCSRQSPRWSSGRCSTLRGPARRRPSAPPPGIVVGLVAVTPAAGFVSPAVGHPARGRSRPSRATSLCSGGPARGSTTRSTSWRRTAWAARSARC